MNCSRLRRMLIREGVITGEPREWHDAHLDDCPRCREETASLLREEGLLRAAYRDLPLRPGFTREVMERIQRKAEE